WTAFAAAAVPAVAVSLGSAELGPRLAEPALALMAAVGAGILAIAVLPLPKPSPRPLPRPLPTSLKSALRDPGTVLLLTATAAYLSLTLFGGVLLPKPGDLRPDQ